MDIDPNEAIAAAQRWGTAALAASGVLAAFVVALARIYVSTRRKLDTVLRGVEEATDGAEPKSAVRDELVKQGLDAEHLDRDIARATGKPPKSLRRNGV